jgi:hypothetical protein
VSAPTALPAELARRFEALIFDWDGTAVADRAADAGALRGAVESASTLGLEMAVVSGARVEDVDGQLRARPHGPGELHLLLNRGSEVYRVGQNGVELTARLTASETQELALDRAAALTGRRLGACARWYFEYLWQRGVSPEQVLIVGDELGGPAAFARLLDRQLALRRRGALPIVSSDPCWTLAVDGVEHESERAHEALLTIADGCLGTRGSVLAPGRGSTPAVLMAGVYRGHGELSELQPAPLSRSARRCALPAEAGGAGVVAVLLARRTWGRGPARTRATSDARSQPAARCATTLTRRAPGRRCCDSDRGGKRHARSCRSAVDRPRR